MMPGPRLPAPEGESFVAWVFIFLILSVYVAVGAWIWSLLPF